MEVTNKLQPTETLWAETQAPSVWSATNNWLFNSWKRKHTNKITPLKSINEVKSQDKLVYIV